jgi:hypothetical protein
MQGTPVSDTPTRSVAGGVSAVSWGAIIAGTAVAAATSLLLFALAAGFDLASLSSWPHRGLSAASLTTLAAVTLIVTQWISAGLGGYITGRLRTSWVGTHTHEVFFRDTAHGFITWCVATVLLASGVFSPAASSPGAALRRDAVAAMGAQAAWMGAQAACRATPSCPAQSASVPQTVLPSELLAYPAPAVGEPGESRPLLPVTPASTGSGSPAGSELSPAGELSIASNEPLVDAQFANATDINAADVANAADVREAATSSVVTALSMLIGAFIASVSAALGGRLRDLHP